MKLEKDNRKLGLSLLPVFAGAFTVIAGISVIIGWHTHNIKLIQINPAFAPMQYNTALAFIFCGLAVLFIFFGKLGPALACSVVPLATGILTSLEYIFGLNIGIDTLFIQPYILTRVSHLGRMAPNTAICFILVGISLLLLQNKKLHFRKFFLAIEVLNAIVFNLGLVAFIGYLTDIPTAYGWGYFSGMSAHTAVTFIVIGAGIFVLVLLKSSEEKIHLQPIIAVLAWIIFAVFTLCFWQAISDREKDNIHQFIESEAANIETMIIQHIDTRVSALKRMAKRWSASGQPLREEWEYDAGNYIVDFPGYQSIEWVDSDLYVRWVVPLKGNEEAQDLDLKFEERRKAAFEAARRQNKLAVVSGINLVQGGKGLLIGIPIFYKDEFAGFILGVFRVPALLNDILSEDIKSNYCVSIFETGGLAYCNFSGRLAEKNKFTAEKDIDFYGIAWKMRLTPLKQVLDKAETPINEIVLAFGSLFSLLMWWLVRLLQKNAEFNLGLRAEKEEINAILNFMSDGLVVMDIAKRVILINPLAEYFLGVTKEGCIGKECVSLVSNAKMRQITQYVLDKAINETKSLSANVELDDSRGGKSKIIRLDSSILRGGRGELSGVIIIMRDITREYELDRLKSEFLSTAAHELRTPLTSIQGFSEILATRKDLDETKRQQFLKLINEGSVRLASLVSGLLDVSRIESRVGIELHKESFFLEEIIEPMVDNFRVISRKHYFELSRLKEPGGLRILADKEKIQQVLTNIINNAIKYSPQGGKIAISGRRTDKKLEISIKDEGIGIPKEEIPKIFEKFYRVDNEITRQTAGTGLGLYISRYIIEEHGGGIRVESELGKGSNFIITLPAV